MRQLRIIGLVLALTGASSVWAQVGDARDPGPALWVVRSGDAAVYLFGRMAVRNDSQWLTPAIEESFDASDMLWLENPRGDPEQGNQLIGELGFSKDYSILEVIDERDRNRVIALLERAGMSADALDGRKVWLANLFLSQLIDRMNNVDGSALPDTILRARAEAQGKPVRSEWRDVREVVEYSVGLPESVQLQMLGKALDDSESYSSRLDAWLRGDIDFLSGMADEIATDYPDAHRRVNVERNSQWVARIREMLAVGNVQFVSIGIGHLVGPDNVLSQLRADGMEVQRR